MNFSIAVAIVGLISGQFNWLNADGFNNIRLRLINGSSIRATIDAVDQNGRITGSDELADVGLSEIVGIDTGRKIVPKKTDGLVKLRMGGVFPAENIAIANDQLETARFGKSQSLPLEIVRAIVYQNDKLVESTLAKSSNEFDSIVVSTKRGVVVVAGILESVTSTHVNIAYEGKSKRISLEKVLAIVTADLGQEDPPGVLAKVFLTDGSRIEGCVGNFRNAILNLRLSATHNLPIPAGQIAKIAFQSERVVYLSDVQPIRVEQQSQFAAPREWQRDLSLLGNPIRLKYGSTGKVLDFEKGIGTRSFTSLVFSNSNNSSHLRAVVGIDLETGGQGDCEMVVEGDGIRLWSKRVRATDDPEPITVDITGINEIALIVLPGEIFDLADHADWADVRLTKSD